MFFQSSILFRDLVDRIVTKGGAALIADYGHSGGKATGKKRENEHYKTIKALLAALADKFDISPGRWQHLRHVSIVSTDR
jgi:hypothetical protein